MNLSGYIENFTHTKTTVLSWYVQNFVVIGPTSFEHKSNDFFSSNLKFNWNIVSGTGTYGIYRSSHHQFNFSHVQASYTCHVHGNKYICNKIMSTYMLIILLFHWRLILIMSVANSMAFVTHIDKRAGLPYSFLWQHCDRCQLASMAPGHPQPTSTPLPDKYLHFDLLVWIKSQHVNSTTQIVISTNPIKPLLLKYFFL